MKDKNGVEIQTGMLLKRCGNVRMADGLRYKVSKHTWKVSKVEDGKVFYESKFIGNKEEEIVEDLELKLPKEEGSFLVVGDENGLYDEFVEKESVAVIKVGSVSEKYEVLKDIPDRGWKTGDVVSIVGKVSFDTLSNGWLKLVDKSKPHKHVLIVADPIQMGVTQN